MYAGAHFRAVPAPTQEWDQALCTCSSGNVRHHPLCEHEPLLRYPSSGPSGRESRPVVLRDTGANDNIAIVPQAAIATVAASTAPQSRAGAVRLPCAPSNQKGELYQCNFRGCVLIVTSLRNLPC
jgi:hypothetical protein